MAKRYEVRERSFINGRLCEPGDIVTLEIDSPGSNLRLLYTTQDGGAGGGAGQQSAGGAPAAFTIKHNGGGRWIVIDTEGEKVGDFVGGKDDAQAEADRLIAGGAPLLKPAEPAVDAGAATTNTTGQDGGAGGGADPTMPDA